MMKYAYLMIAIAIIVIIYLLRRKKYNESSYHEITNISYTEMKHDKGTRGEFNAFLNLEQFESDGAKLLPNLYVPKKDGEDTEVDLVMISYKGLIVIEVKNYGGWIFGNENQRNWYQILPAKHHKSEKETLYNPVWQNRTHIKAILNYLGREVPVYSVIVFSDRATFKSIETNKGDYRLIYMHQLTSAIKEIIDDPQPPFLTPSDVDLLYRKLYPLTQSSETTKLNHIADVYHHSMGEPSNPFRAKTVSSSQPKTSTEICPRCGGNLVVRTARQGGFEGQQFYGCSNYPKCCYTRHIGWN